MTTGGIVKSMTIAAAAAVIAGSALAGGPAWGKKGQGSGLLAAAAAIAPGSVDAQETEGLVFTREEEKLARDVYLAMFAAWRAPVFANIAASEQVHMEAIKLLLDRYAIADPVGADAQGVFSNPELQKLYADLVAKGSLSYADALAVGALIEELDLRDVTALLADADDLDLDLVYQNLAKGSRNHLRSFVAQLEAVGGAFVPVYLDQATVDTILASPRERGLLGADGKLTPPPPESCDGSGRRGSNSPNGSGNGAQGGNGPVGAGQNGAGTGSGTCDGTGRP